MHELLTTDGLSASAISDAAMCHADAIELSQETLHHPHLRLTSAYPSMAELYGWDTVRKRKKSVNHFHSKVLDVHSTENLKN